MVSTCDICGREIMGKPRLKYVEGAKLQVCQNCSKFGRTATVKPSYGDSTPKFTKIHTTPKRTVKIKDNSNIDLIDDYSLKIKQSREKLKLTQDELGKKINEPASLIKRIEQGKVRPSIKITKKLERSLNIILLEKSDDDDDEFVPKQEKTTGAMTLGDMIIIKKKKKKDEE